MIVEAKLSPPQKLNEFEEVPFGTFRRLLVTSPNRRVIAPGKEKDITPWKDKKNIYRNRYLIFSHEDGSGVLRMKANSAASWAVVPGSDNKMNIVFGSRVYSLGPSEEERDLFVIMRRTRRGYFAYSVVGGGGRVMPIYEAYPKTKGLIVKEYTTVDQEELIENHHLSRRILPNHIKMVTSVKRRREPHFSLWGCRYMAYARGDEEETGIIRMTANSAFSWGVVYLPDRREFVRVLGTNNFQIGLQSPIFPLVRVTKEGDVIDKSIIWRPNRRRSE